MKKFSLSFQPRSLLCGCLCFSLYRHQRSRSCSYHHYTHCTVHTSVAWQRGIVGMCNTSVSREWDGHGWSVSQSTWSHKQLTQAIQCIYKDHLGQFTPFAPLGLQFLARTLQLCNFNVHVHHSHEVGLTQTTHPEFMPRFHNCISLCNSYLTRLSFYESTWNPIRLRKFEQK